MQPTLIETTSERFHEMLGAVPPADMTGGGFLVGEAIGYHKCRIADVKKPDYRAFFRTADDKYFEVREPLTKAEFRACSLDDAIKALGRTIVVIVSGGVVQRVANVPAGVTVEVRDYDVDGSDDLPRDAAGAAYEYAIYCAEG